MLRIWRDKSAASVVELDSTPSGSEEELYLFENPINKPTDLNQIVLQERMQDMGERLIFSDRAFLIVIIWVIFLVTLPILQMIFSIWGIGLTNPQFVTVITTTTASVFGFWYLVGSYLFPKNGVNTGKKKSTNRAEKATADPSD